MTPSRANEIPELIRRLGSRKPACVDAARARLSVIGPRAVEDLIEALEGDDSRIRALVMPLLALIQDSRARGPLVAMLLDRNSRLREAAARSLARFPSQETVAALLRVLGRERLEGVRVAAVQALVEQVAAGQDDAIPRVLELLNDAKEPVPIRLAASALLPLLRPSARENLLERLKRDLAEPIRQCAERIEANGGSDTQAADLATLVSDVASNDYRVWNLAVHRLAACGSTAIAPLLAEMESRAHDPEFCKRAGMALKGMGPRRGRAVADALDSTEEPLPLQVLVEVIGALGEKSLIYRLKDLIDRLARRPPLALGILGWDPMERVRAKAHLELARIGSRVAVPDLREALSSAERRVEVEMLKAVELVGKREEIGVLLRAYDREDDFMKERIADVVRAIMKRERIRRNDRMFQELASAQLAALEEILPRPSPRSNAKRESRPLQGVP